MACNLALTINAKQVHLEQVKLCILTKGLHAQTSDGTQHCESKGAALLKSGEDLNLSVGKAASVDVGLVAEAFPIFKRERWVVLGLTIHFDFFGTLDSGAGIAANRGGDLIKNAAFKLDIGNALLNNTLHFVVAVWHKVHNREAILEGGEKAVKLSRRKDEAHFGEVEAILHVLIGVVNDAFLFRVKDGEEGGDQLARQFVRLIEEDHTFSVLNLRHHLFEEHFFVLDAAAVDLKENFLCCGTNGAGKLGLANAALTVKHEKGKDARGLVSVQIKGKLALDVFLSDDVIEVCHS